MCLRVSCFLATYINHKVGLGFDQVMQQLSLVPLKDFHKGKIIAKAKMTTKSGGYTKTQSVVITK